MLQTVSRLTKNIQDGDLVIVYESFTSLKAVDVTSTGHFQNAYGLFPMKDWIGLPFGTKVSNKLKTAWVHLLAPTPELWTLVLKHRTQILYLADIAMICSRLELRPGSIVLESGTGSGSLTHSLARAVAPHGKVYSFDFHEVRVREAAKEFERNGIKDVVSIDHRNIERDGFPETLHGCADAVFLDLPGPWHVVPSAAKCLRPGGMFCGFSPCIEQVQSTTEKLNFHGFQDIQTLEILLREFEVVPRDRKIQKMSVKNMLKIQKEKFHSRDDNVCSRLEGSKEDNKCTKSIENTNDSNILDKEENGISGNKRQKIDETEIGKNGDKAIGNIEETNQDKNAIQEDQLDPDENISFSGARSVVAKPVRESKGHTGFLTFALKAIPL